MKIMVCGPISGRRNNIIRIKQVYDFLRKQGFETLDHISAANMDYSYMDDFRNQKALSDKITQKDLDFVKQANVLIVLAEQPSYGTTIEQYIAKNMKKTVIVFSKMPVSSPWPISFSDFVVTNEDDLCKELVKLYDKTMK